ncbi:hypothetical protein ACH4E8_34340 [Streptomyces sp. NPDC017979]|uniref:hypothetical protein n=1 Tax=Streptomyces sp. NPDC017979 TaxID=3365024 RepID=UPI00378A0001
MSDDDEGVVHHLPTRREPASPVGPPGLPPLPPPRRVGPVEETPEETTLELPVVPDRVSAADDAARIGEATRTTTSMPGLPDTFRSSPAATAEPPAGAGALAAAAPLAVALAVLRTVITTIDDWRQRRADAHTESAPLREAKMKAKVATADQRAGHVLKMQELANKLRQAQAQQKTVPSGGSAGSGGGGKGAGSGKPGPSSGSGSSGTGASKNTSAPKNGGGLGKNDGKPKPKPEGNGKGKPSGADGAKLRDGRSGGGKPDGKPGGKSNGSGGGGKPGDGKSGGKSNGSGSDKSGGGKPGGSSTPALERSRGRQERATGRQAARDQRRAAQQAADLADRSKDRDQARKDADRTAKDERAAKKAEEAKTQDKTLAEAVADELERRLKERREDLDKPVISLDKDDEDDEKRGEGEAEEASETSTPTDEGEETSSPAGDPEAESAFAGPDDLFFTDDTGFVKEASETSTPTDEGEETSSPAGDPEAESAFAGPDDLFFMDREDAATSARRATGPARDPFLWTRDDPTATERPAVTTGQRALPQAPEPHTERPGTSAPDPEPDGPITPADDTPRAADPPPTKRTTMSGMEVRTSGGTVAVQHRTELNLGGYLGRMSRIALSTGSAQEKAAETAEIMSNANEALTAMFKAVASDDNVNDPGLLLLMDTMMEEAALLAYRAERMSRSCEEAYDQTRMAARAVNADYRRDQDLKNDAGLASTSAASHHLED